jgi:hypothetical protein
MRNIISFPFNIPRDGGEVECHGARPKHPRLATALHRQECVEFTEAKDRSCKSASMTIFRTRFAAVNQFIRLIEETKAIGS